MMNLSSPILAGQISSKDKAKDKLIVELSII